MAYINLSTPTKLARSHALNDAIGGNAVVVIYDGVHPVTPDLPTTANALVTFACNAASFGTVSQAANSTTVTLTARPIAPQQSQANGIATWARISSNAVANAAIIDLDVALANASVIMSATDLIGNVPVQIASINITEQ